MTKMAVCDALVELIFPYSIIIPEFFFFQSSIFFFVFFWDSVHFLKLKIQNDGVVTPTFLTDSSQFNLESGFIHKAVDNANNIEKF